MGRRSRRTAPVRKVHLHAVTSDTPYTFTDGVPTGELAGQFWHELLRYLEQDVAQAGWDQPSLLFGLTDPQTSQREFGQPVADLLAATQAQAAAKAVTVVGAELLGEISTGPYDWLVGQRAPHPFMAVVLVSESWMARMSDPELNHLRPSQRPDRVELRMLTAVTAAGEVFTLIRERGKEPEAMGDAMSMGGRVVDAMRRYLRTPMDPPVFDLADLYGRMVLQGVMLPLGLVPSPGQRGDLVAMINKLAGQDRHLRARMTSAAITGTVMILAEAVLPTRRARALSEQLEAATAAAEEDVLGIDACAQLLRQIAEEIEQTLSWQEMPYSGGMLSRFGVDAAVARWMGPTMLANEIVGDVPGQKAALEAIGQVPDGEDLRAVAERGLAALGWLYPESDEMSSGPRADIATHADLNA